jgi:predicted site-specific integrase-resolvase
MPDTVSQREAADILGVSEKQIAKYRATGRLAFARLDNGGIRIHRAHVLALASLLAEPRPTKAPVRISNDARELPASILRAPSRRAEFAA